MNKSHIYLLGALLASVGMVWFYNTQNLISQPQSPPPRVHKETDAPSPAPLNSHETKPSGFAETGKPKITTPEIESSQFAGSEQSKANQIIKYFNSGKYADALAMAQQWLKQGDHTPQFMQWLNRHIPVLETSLGWQLVQTGQCQLALNHFENSIQLQSIPETHKGLAYCYYKLKQLDNAEDSVVQFINSGQIDPNISLIYADILESKDRFEEATEVLDKLKDQGAMNPQIKGRIDSMRAKLAESYRQNTLDSGHFKISYRTPDHDLLATIAHNTLESALQEFIDIWQLQYPEETIEVLLYPANKFGHLVSYGPQWASGLYDGRLRIQVKPNVLQDPHAQDFQRLLRHELVHALIAEQVDHREMPYWFNEGIAMLLECPQGCKEPANSEISLGGKFLPIETFETKFVELSKENAALVYQQSLHIVHTLIKSRADTDPNIITNILRSLRPSSSLESNGLIEPARMDFATLYQKSANRWELLHQAHSGN